MKILKFILVTSVLSIICLTTLQSFIHVQNRAITAVKPFNLERYLGKWYEIARLDYKYEKHLDNVTATYSFKDDGTVRVDNKGYNYKKEKWEESIGKAKPVDDPNEGKLKVSFFGPFYSDYNVININTEYKYALVAGKSTDYLWILSREKTIPEIIKTRFLTQAQTLGYPIDKLLWVKHDKD